MGREAWWTAENACMRGWREVGWWQQTSRTGKKKKKENGGNNSIVIEVDWSTHF